MKCPYCGNDAEWVDNATVYGKRFGKSYMMWVCRPCDARVGCHQNTQKPLGTLANKELRDARMRVHALIDPLWKSKHFSRGRVYNMLSDAFGEPVHVGESDLSRCAEILETAPKLFQLP
jgi:hypothetical protein